MVAQTRVVVMGKEQSGSILENQQSWWYWGIGGKGEGS